MINIVISELTPRDLEELRALYLRVRVESFTWLETESFELDDFDESTKDELVLVAKVEDQSVGFISIWEPDKFIHNLFIDTSFHGKGIGTALIKDAQKRVGLPLSLKCMKSNANASGYYLSHKWEVVREEVDSNGPYYFMQLNL